jgi:hypothetical protein
MHIYIFIYYFVLYKSINAIINDKYLRSYKNLLRIAFIINFICILKQRETCMYKKIIDLYIIKRSKEN